MTWQKQALHGEAAQARLTTQESSAGVLALVEWPTIDRIFLAALLLLQDRRPMRPVFHRVQPH
jgi:hypothetical protein